MSWGTESEDRAGFGLRDFTNHTRSPSLEHRFALNRIQDEALSHDDNPDDDRALDVEGDALLGPERTRFSGTLKYLPWRLPQALEHVCSWIKGPAHSCTLRVEPFFGSVQSRPASSLSKRGPRLLVCSLSALLLLFLFAFFLILNRSLYGCEVAGYGRPKRLSCTSRFWPDSKTCGVDGESCRPFNNGTFAFRCPANCQDAKIFNPRYIGHQDVNYQPLVIGGSRLDGSLVYRGDSFICGAALHAGLIGKLGGGIVVVSLTGVQSNYPSVDANGVYSIGFEPSFPLSITFKPASASSMQSSFLCGDPRWTLLAVTVVFTSAISIWFASPGVFFWVSFVAIYCCVALAVNPPDYEDFNNVVSSAFGRFLPAAFVAFVIYRFCVRRTLSGLTAFFERTILWLAPCWVGALNNFTFDRLPIQRLTPHDLRSQAGAIPVLVLIVLVILVVALGQAWAFRVEGRLPKYLAFYGILALGLLVLVAIPDLNLRLHHYIIALLLLPGTALQTRPSLVYQGLLVGLFISGVARWGFASILETSASLVADGPVGGLLPQVATPAISGNLITFNWANLTQAAGAAGKLQGGFDSISILINDVERFRGIEDHRPGSFTWTRYKPGEVEFFRLAFVKFGQVGRDVVFDYTKPGTWFGNGSWSHFGA